ncbi:FAD-dependent thiol oxidase [Multifurca ochricompacta]|uniref:Sulfhydryl oxidase n=1 Tax=Multifurca ochricompacta TaxID=376703 RepID=A0AAD4MAL6_9AGAM|nr:FAD-dependent thiol oxidase [Multifurca ochricompacta]
MTSSINNNAGQPQKSTARPLPPGMVLGPDGKPCKICTSFRNWKPPSSSTKPSTTKSNKGNDTSASAQRPPSPASAGAADENKRPAYCPPDVESLGRATWTFLHTTAAYYPESPTPTQRAHMLQLLHALPQLYPCSHCANDLGTRIQRQPPDVRSRTALAAWLCATHNEVNVMLGKPIFNCSRVDERWKDGPQDGSCD